MRKAAGYDRGGQPTVQREHAERYETPDAARGVPAADGRVQCEDPARDLQAQDQRAGDQPAIRDPDRGVLPKDPRVGGSRPDPMRRADPDPEGQAEESLHIVPSERVHLLREREAPRQLPARDGSGQGLRRRLERHGPPPAVSRPPNLAQSHPFLFLPFPLARSAVEPHRAPAAAVITYRTRESALPVSYPNAAVGRRGRTCGPSSTRSYPRGGASGT